MRPRLYARSHRPRGFFRTCGTATVGKETDDDRQPLIKRKCELLENALTQSLAGPKQFQLIEQLRSLNDELLPLIRADYEQTALAVPLMSRRGTRIKSLSRKQESYLPNRRNWIRPRPARQSSVRRDFPVECNAP
jgi:hypothetical protein